VGYAGTGRGILWKRSLVSRLDRAILWANPIARAAVRALQMPSSIPKHTEPPQAPTIRTWARILASIIAIAGIPAVGWQIYSLILKSTWPGIFPAIRVAAVIWLLPLFTIVAATGRIPRKWPGIRTTDLYATSPSRLGLFLRALNSRSNKRT
jgi:hypothetical protein